MSRRKTNFDRAGSSSLVTLIDLAFYALLVTSAGRYLSSHGLDGAWYWVAALSSVLAVAYASLRWLPPRGAAVGSLVVLSLWSALVFLAPSFWWCAFSLFFISRRRLPRSLSIITVGIITTVTVWALTALARNVEWTIPVGAIVIAILLNSVYSRIDRDNVKLERLISDQIRTREQLASTEHQAGMLAERQRISHELHDTVTQGLTSSLLMMEASLQTWESSPDDARSSLAIATNTVRANLEETRNMVHQLGSPRLDGVSLSAALQRLTDELPGAECYVEGEPYQLDEDTTHAVLRISQSALENVRQHAQAKQVRLTLTYLPKQVNLDILDDGVGFVPDQTATPSARGGYGLRAMQQRVDTLGGIFTIESTPGEGTAIAAQFPTAPITSNHFDSIPYRAAS
ncbi:sensor histidine kinase [Lysinibacter sp. HNR]|uniref:sensor histidine kinase n=1 Tax=Lysinibacter sp. HNR TaxID=3031408 RepID=UPI00243556AC|nr:sensor histidine kinase [Lysinibacter sp. HNR]WGD37166.1 sensor histidine kinase [Lysinibacter sp. HNR]